MATAVEKMLSLRRNEIGTASLLFAYLFLVIGAFMMGQAVGDAMFLRVFPTHLPSALIASAVATGAMVAVYIRLSTRLRLEWLVIGTLLFFAVSFACFWVLTNTGTRWIYLLIFIWVNAAGAMGPMMGWTLANYALTTREARRIFGFIGAGAIFGGTFVSFVTSDMLRHGQLRPQTLLLAMTLLLACCALLVRVLFHSARERLSAVSDTPAAGHGTPEGFGQSLNLIRSSRYLLLVSTLIAVGCLSTCILGYQFKLTAKAWYGDDTAGLAAFFTRFNAYVGLAALIFQLTLTGPLLRTFGIRVTLLITPIVMMGTSLGFMIAPTLLIGIIMRGSKDLMRFSFDRASMELLYLPVASGMKRQVKSFIDTFIWRSADGIAGLVLLLFANVLHFTTSEVSAVNLVILVGWVAIAFAVRREYLNVLRQAIDRRTLDPELTTTSVLDSTTADVLAETLEHGGEQQLLYGLSLFEMDRRKVWHPALRTLLQHRSPAVRETALRLLSDAGDREILPQAENMLGDESLEVRAEALRYLVVHFERDPLMLVTQDRNLPVYVVQGAIGAYFARSMRMDSTGALDLIVESMLNQAGPDAVPARRQAARLLGLVEPPSELHSHLHRLLHDQETSVVEESLLSAGKVRRPDLLPLILDMLARPRLAASARMALAMYGRSAVATLQSYLNDRAVPLPIRRQIPNTLARIPVRESAVALAHSLIQSDPKLRHDVVRALNTLRERDAGLLPQDVDYADMVNIELIGYYRSFQILAALEALPAAPTDQFPNGSAGLLKRTLRERMEEELEQLFRLLALVYPQRDIRNAFVGLTSGQPRLQANALEVLEHLLHPEVYRRLANVLDPEVDPQQRLEFARQFCRADVSSAADAVRILIYSEDVWLRTCAVYVVGSLRLRQLAQDMSRVQTRDDPLLDETHKWTLARLRLVAGGA